MKTEPLRAANPKGCSTVATAAARRYARFVSTSAQADPPLTSKMERPQHAAFVTTHWSVVLTAAGSDTTRAHDALAKLCQTYWPPLYAFARRRGSSPEDAQDLTQGFFEHLLERNAVAAVSPEKGRFRSFLLASFSNFISGEWTRANAQKRGGGKTVSLDTHDAETWLTQQPANDFTPERAFELRWAISLLEEVYRKLEAEHRASGKAELFKALRTTLAGPGSAAPYAELAQRLKMSEAAVRVTVHRLRQRYRALLRETIAETVGTREEVEEELRHLVRILSS
jgi:RNA polymerase sigma factor (sigma-70 family)